MPDPFITDRLQWIQESIASINQYTKNIESAKDFKSYSGVMAYDAVLMRLQGIGENIKTIHKHSPDLFDSIEYEIYSIVRFREIISHHYEKLDIEIVFDICTEQIPLLQENIEAILNSLM